MATIATAGSREERERRDGECTDTTGAVAVLITGWPMVIV
jgi:hypothetical protein